MRKRKSGFTLIELLIVMAVIAALMGALVPVALSAISHANATRIAENLRAMVSQVQQYAYSDHVIPNVDQLKGSVSGANLSEYEIWAIGTKATEIDSTNYENGLTLTSSQTYFAVVYNQSFNATDVWKVWSGATSLSVINSNLTSSDGSVGATGVVVRYW